MNYSSLTTAIQNYTENSEATFVSHIPDFVRQAEEEIYREIQIPDLRKNSSATLTASNRYLAKPSDYLSVFSLSVLDATGAYSFLLRKDLSFIREAYPLPSTEGIPVHYANHDVDTFIVGPTPDVGYSVQMSYFYDPESIVTASTSWLGDNAETVLLSKSLYHAYIFMKGEPDILAMYDKQYTDGMGKLALLVQSRDKRDDYREGDRRIKL